MTTVEHLLLCFADENRFNHCIEETGLSSLVDDIGRKLHKLDVSTRHEFLNSLYYNSKSGGYSSLLHLCFLRMINNHSLKYSLWKLIYIFCELGLNPMNVNHIPLNQIKLSHSMRDSLHSLLQIQEENEMKDIRTQILTLKSRESSRSNRSNPSNHSGAYQNHSNASTPSSCDFNVGDINNVFGDEDCISFPFQQQKHNMNPRISPSHSKLKRQPRSWIDLQLNDHCNITKRNIIEVLSYSAYHEHSTPAIFTIYLNSASCCTILGNAFVCLKHFDPNTLYFALCKLSASKMLSVVDNISYYDIAKMNEYEVLMTDTDSIDLLKRNIHAQYKRNPSERFGNYLCYLYLIKRFYDKFQNDSYHRFIKHMYEPIGIELNEQILNVIKMYTFEDFAYCNTDAVGEHVENKWICIWFDSLNDNVYSEEWMKWISKYILRRLSSIQKEYLAAYLTKRGHAFIKSCNKYQLKYNMLDILQRELKQDNISSYINPKWFLNNVVLRDTLLVQKLLIYCLNKHNYKDLCVTVLWSLLTNASFAIESKFFDEIIDIIKKFSNNNSYFVNGCCQSIVDSIFSIRHTFLEQNVYSQRNITTFLLNIAHKNRCGELSVDINKGLVQCTVSMPHNLILLKILTSNDGLLDFNVCVQRGIINSIQSQIQYVQNTSIQHVFYSWYQYHTHSNSNSNSTPSLHSASDEQCIVM